MQERAEAWPIAFGVGTAKSGTHALARMVEPALRTAHEPQADSVLNLVIALHGGHLSRGDFTTLVGQLIERQRLAFNVSQINGFIIDALVERFPGARYILTLRDCYSWVRSFINHQLTVRLPPGSPWIAFRELRFRPAQHTHPVEERALASRGLYSLDAYLSYWEWHNAQVLRSVPATRLLVVATDHLEQDTEQIAAFLGLAGRRLRADPEQRFAGRYLDSPLDLLARDYVESCTAAATQRLLAALSEELRGSVQRVLNRAPHPRCA